MATYMIVYLGGEQPSDPEAQKKHFADYRAWLGSLGEALVSPANPLKDTHVISGEGKVSPGTQSTMSGFTVIETDSMQSALDMARTCPFLDIGGTLEVSELMRLDS